MKKTLLLALMALVCCLAKAQESATGNDLEYQIIIKTDSLLKKDLLYSKAIEWFSNTFVSGKSVIQSQDQTAGVIIGKFTFNTTAKLGWLGNQYETSSALIKVSVKDGKVKCDIYDFENHDYGLIKDGVWQPKGAGKGVRIKIYEQLKADSKNQFDVLTSSLTAYIQTVNKNDNW